MVADVSPELDLLVQLEHTNEDEFLLMSVCDFCFIKNGFIVQFLNNIITIWLGIITDDVHHLVAVQARD